MYVKIPPRFGCSAEAAPAPKARKAPNTKFKLERNIHHIGSSLDETAGWPIANLCAALCLPIANSSACPLQHVSSAVALPHHIRSTLLLHCTCRNSIALHKSTGARTIPGAILARLPNQRMGERGWRRGRTSIPLVKLSERMLCSIARQQARTHRLGRARPWPRLRTKDYPPDRSHHGTGDDGADTWDAHQALAGGSH